MRVAKKKRKVNKKKTVVAKKKVVVKKKRNKKKEIPYIPGGYWQHDEVKGMPKIDPPPPLSKGKLDNEEIKEYVIYEGVPDSIETIPTKKIKDTELRKMWGEAQKAITKVKKFIYDE